MNEAELLQKYFDSFIKLTNPRDFFIGMADYLEFSDSVPEFDRITEEIHAQRKPFEEKLKELEKPALDKLNTAYKEISEYSAKNKIEDEQLKRELTDCDMWFANKVSSNFSLVMGLYTALEDVIRVLHGIPDHKPFASKYVEYYRNNESLVNRYFFAKEVNDYSKFEQEIKRRSENELWGRLAEVGHLYQIVKKGREMHESLIEKHKVNASAHTSFDILNSGVIVGEWVAIEENNPRQKNNLFFNIERVHPWLVRLHNHVLKEYTLNKTRKTEPKPTKANFDTDKSFLIVENNEVKIKKFSEQYHALRIIFADPDELGKEWFFSEIAEKIDPADIDDKKYYNAVYQVIQKLKTVGISDFFITTRQSVKITPHYLS